MIHPVVLNIIAYALVLGMIFPKVFPYYTKMLTWLFKGLENVLQLLLKVITEALKLLAYLLEQIV